MRAVLALALAGGCTGQIGDADRTGGDPRNPRDPGGPEAVAGGDPAHPATGGAAGASSPLGPLGTLPVAGSGPLPASAPGPSPLRRLTRDEYDATVSDLLGDDTRPARAFAAETLVHGFDNNASAQAVTGTRADDYLSAAEAIAGRALTRLPTLLGCSPAQAGEDACARTFIAAFARRAYRRPPTMAELGRLQDAYAAGRKLGTFETGIEVVITRVLQSPQFLYRLEVGEPAGGGRTRPTSYEMASRLSYLLWGSMPDDALFRAADANMLTTRDQVAAQARRMLDSPKTRKVAAHFHELWLNLARIDEFEKDATVWKDWRPDLRASMKQETQQLIDDVLWKSDGDLRRLLTADYTFVNKDLATFLGVPGAGTMTGAFQRVALAPAGSPGPMQRIGLLGHAGLLAALAKANQTSPVLRGKFVLEQLACITVPPPPPDVANAPPAAPGATVRQRFEAHEQAACAGCHRLMDPIGFALESFDGVGRWRAQDAGKPVDVRATVAGLGDLDGMVTGEVELARKVASSAQLGACLARQWFRFAAGRDEVMADARTIIDLAATLDAKSYSVKELMVALTQSDAFLFISKEVTP